MIYQNLYLQWINVMKHATALFPKAPVLRKFYEVGNGIHQAIGQSRLLEYQKRHSQNRKRPVKVPSHHVWPKKSAMFSPPPAAISWPQPSNVHALYTNCGKDKLRGNRARFTFTSRPMAAYENIYTIHCFLISVEHSSTSIAQYFCGIVTTLRNIFFSFLCRLETTLTVVQSLTSVGFLFAILHESHLLHCCFLHQTEFMNVLKF